MGNFSEIIERLERAEGPDREIDAEVFTIAGMPLPDEFLNRRVGIAWDMEQNCFVADIMADFQVRFDHPHYTASLDAAIGLVERMLPECYRELSGPRKYLNIPTSVPNRFRAEITTNSGFQSSTAVGWGKYEPIALILALFHVLEATEKQS